MWIIPRPLLNKMLGHAQREAPRECVGLLSGHGRQASHWHPLTNSAAELDRYLADPAQQIRAFHRIREEGRELVAIYHSHPGSAALPSMTDLQQAWYPGVLQLIITLQVEGRLEMQGFLITDGEAIAQELDIRE